MALVKVQHQKTLQQNLQNDQETSHQASIRAALEFLEAQKTSSAPSLSIYRVALEFGIANQTLHDAIKNGIPNRRGPPTILTAYEEKKIAGYCLNMQQLGFELTKEAVNTMVMQILSSQNQNIRLIVLLVISGGKGL